MTIYEEEALLREQLYAHLRQIRAERPHVSGGALADYSQCLRELHDVQSRITSLEEAEDA